MCSLLHADELEMEVCTHMHTQVHTHTDIHTAASAIITPEDYYVHTHTCIHNLKQHTTEVFNADADIIFFVALVDARKSPKGESVFCVACICNSVSLPSPSFTE